MDCINYSSSEYKSLLRDSGLSKMELDAAILVHQNNNKTDKMEIEIKGEFVFILFFKVNILDKNNLF